VTIDASSVQRWPRRGLRAGRLIRRLSRLTAVALVLYAAGLGLVLGVGSVFWLMRSDYPFGAVSVGPWKAWPRVGSPDADPYARAMVTRRAEIPLAIGEGLALTAIADSSGGRLDSRCTYRIAGTTPPARLWTLTLYDAERSLIATDLGRYGLTSMEVLRASDGRFEILLSRDLRAGNWLQLPQHGEFSLALRLYETPAAIGSGALDGSTLPAIDRIACEE
jgi:hypothetical protein